MRLKTEIRSRAGFRYIFGPAASRRMGLSLGVDLVPRKTCNYDCAFCEVGPTSLNTTVRREYVPTHAVISELRRWLRGGGRADFITLCGSGEPTLHSGFGKILDAVRGMTRIRTALLTNGALLMLPRVRRDAAKADVVKVSVSAWDEKSFRKVNHPGAGARFAEVLAGMRAFSGEFTGELWVEVMVLSGVNDDDASMRRIAALVAGLKPRKVHLNTVVRPPARPVAKPASAARLRELAAFFTPRAVIVAGRTVAAGRKGRADTDAIVALLKRRPCSVQDVAQGLGIGRAAAASALASLVRGGTVRRRRQGGKVYHVCD